MPDAGDHFWLQIITLGTQKDLNFSLLQSHMGFGIEIPFPDKLVTSPAINVA